MNYHPIRRNDGQVRAIQAGTTQIRLPMSQQPDLTYRVGMKLWVQECWAVDAAYDRYSPTQLTQHVKRVAYRAGGGCEFEFCERGKWRPSTHMPQWASRITLEVIDVRKERIKDIWFFVCEFKLLENLNKRNGAKMSDSNGNPEILRTIARHLDDLRCEESAAVLRESADDVERLEAIAKTDRAIVEAIDYLQSKEHVVVVLNSINNGPCPAGDTYSIDAGPYDIPLVRYWGCSLAACLTKAVEARKQTEESEG